MIAAYSLLRMVREMEVPRQFAVNARRRYITIRLDEIDAQVDALVTWLERDDVNAAFVAMDVADLLIEKSRLLREFHYLKTAMVERHGEITDEMIVAARQYPVTQLVEFRHGKSTAWCHEDRNPSLYHGTRTNRAVCPVCDKKFDPISVLKTRDGYTFPQAVLFLSGGGM